MEEFDSSKGRDKKRGSGNRNRFRKDSRSESSGGFEERRSAGDFERPRRRDSGRGFGGRSSGRRDSGNPGTRGRLEMFEVVCDECGKNCEVPFKPSSSKPVYCSECFEHKGNSRGGSSRDSSSRDLDQINIKLDKIMKALKIE